MLGPSWPSLWRWLAACRGVGWESVSNGIANYVFGWLVGRKYNVFPPKIKIGVVVTRRLTDCTVSTVWTVPSQFSIPFFSTYQYVRPGRKKSRQHASDNHKKIMS